MTKKKAKKIERLMAQDELILQAAAWGVQFAETVSNAGGCPVGVFAVFSDDSILAMVRNDLQVL